MVQFLRHMWNSVTVFSLKCSWVCETAQLVMLEPASPNVVTASHLPVSDSFELGSHPAAVCLYHLHAWFDWQISTESIGNIRTVATLTKEEMFFEQYITRLEPVYKSVGGPSEAALSHRGLPMLFPLTWSFISHLWSVLKPCSVDVRAAKLYDFDKKSRVFGTQFLCRTGKASAAQKGVRPVEVTHWWTQFLTRTEYLARAAAKTEGSSTFQITIPLVSIPSLAVVADMRAFRLKVIMNLNTGMFKLNWAF